MTALPEGLNNTYDEAMERIESQHPDQATLARKVLCWVFYASRPLTMLEIRHALAVETGDSALDEDNIPEEDLLLSVCNGLVTNEKEGGFLALVHYTFQQYLEQKGDCLFPEAQVDIVRTCLTYVSFDEFEQGPCHEDKDFELRLQRYPLLRYAVLNWGRHARQGAEEICKDLILSFLSNSAKTSTSVQVLFFRESMGSFQMRRFPFEVSALWLASVYGLEHTVSHLLASQRQIVAWKTTWGDTALHQAAGCGHVGILELLLSNGADMTATDRDGNTSLHMASMMFTSMVSEPWGWIERNVRASDTLLKGAQLLLEHGADVNAVNLRGETALHLSITKRQKSLTHLLLTGGADVILRNRYRAAPLTLASESGDGETARILLKHDLQRQAQCGILDDAMRIAAFKGHLPMLEILLAKSSEQPPLDPEGRSLLHISANGGRLRCLQYLKNRGFDLEALDKQQRTCLHNAAAGLVAGCRAVLEYLLEQGFDPSQSDVDGWTPLLWAAKAGNITNIKMLLHAGADSFYQGDEEWTPFAIATYHGNVRAAAILRPYNRPLPGMFQTQHSSMSLRHPRFSCDGCELVSRRSLDDFPLDETADPPKIIVGSRFKCSECPNFDYCFKCVSSAEITHPSHRFDFVYWDDSNLDVQIVEQQEVMEELTARESFMKSWRA